MALIEMLVAPRIACMRLGEKIKRMRLQRGWNQERLAIAAGISRATIYNAEAAKGAWEVSRKTIDRLANAFNVSIDTLLAGQYKDYKKSVLDIHWDPKEVPEIRERPIWQEYEFGELGYADPPPFSQDQVIKTWGDLTAGLGALPLVIEWFKNLNEEDRRAAISLFDAFAGNVLRDAAKVVSEVGDLLEQSVQGGKPKTTRRRRAAG